MHKKRCGHLPSLSYGTVVPPSTPARSWSKVLLISAVPPLSISNCFEVVGLWVLYIALLSLIQLAHIKLLTFLCIKIIKNKQTVLLVPHGSGAGVELSCVYKRHVYSFNHNCLEVCGSHLLYFSLSYSVWFIPNCWFVYIFIY